jgi:mitogen-activated protein kinase kinase
MAEGLSTEVSGGRLRSRHDLTRAIDIKPGNILFCKNGQVKIADFGVAGEFGTRGTAWTFIGTSLYMAPERFTGQSYTINSDVWSLGVSLLEVAQHRHPYMCAEPYTIRSSLIERLRLIIHGPVPKLLDEPELGIVWSETFKSFIECWYV